MSDEGQSKEHNEQRRWFRTLRSWLAWFRHPIDELDALVSALAVLIVSASIFVLGWITVAFVAALTDPSGSFEAARNLGVILAAAIGLPFLVWRSWVGERQARAAMRQAHSAEENIVTNSFTKAIDQLGSTRDEMDLIGNIKPSPNVEVRLGAVYALQRISSTSDAYKEIVTDIMAAYVREHRGTPPSVYWSDVYGLRVLLPEAAPKNEASAEKVSFEIKQISPRRDVHAALSFLIMEQHRFKEFDWSELDGSDIKCEHKIVTRTHFNQAFLWEHLLCFRNLKTFVLLDQSF
jgi:hypothetical protein